MSNTELRIGVDIGGTFTDLVAVTPDGRVFVEKVLSSVDDYSISIARGISSLLKRTATDAASVSEVVHGTTIATNAILEGKGARTGLITTRGFRDVLEIRNSRRPDMYDIDWVKPTVLIERALRREVEERVDAVGGVLTPIDLNDVDAAIDELIEQSVESVAVCLLNSFANADHELEIERKIRERMPTVSISLSSEILPEPKEYERTSTTAINAYVRPVVERYLNGLRDRLDSIGLSAPILTMQSNGGIINSAAAAKKPINIVESGPAAGVMGAWAVANRIGKDKAITFDMGGTTAKAALIEDGEVTLTLDLEVGAGLSAVSRLNKGGGYALSTPSVDIAEVGVGGGSVVWIDEGNGIRVGPHSAGAYPGPACYNQGGDRPTVTDANVLLGYLNPKHLVGGALAIDIERAKSVFLRDVAQPLGISLEEAAYGVHKVASSGMSRAIRSVSTERGRDPRDAVLIAFGGNGPVHAVELARELELSTVVVPPTPGVFSAIGLLETSIEHNFSRMYLGSFAPEQGPRLAEVVASLVEDASADLRASGAGERLEQVVWLLTADLRYRGQASPLLIKLPGTTITAEIVAGALNDFTAAHQQSFGFSSPDEEVEITGFRLTARLTSESARPTRFEYARSSGPDASRPVYYGPALGRRDTPVISRGDVVGTVPGPVIVEQYDTTVIVPPDCSVEADGAGNLVITLKREAVSANVDTALDSVSRELVRNALQSLADEMALTLVRTCRSGHVKHSGDFSTAIANARGELLAQGVTLPFHLGGMPDATHAVLRAFEGDIHEGDIFAMNDPFDGGMHLPDIFLFKPIFAEGAMQAIAISVVHHVDVGGRTAGGNSTMNTEVFAEGLRLPVLRLVERGVMNAGVLEIIRSNVRVPVKVLGDIRAQISACERGEKEYLSIVSRYGLANVKRYEEQLLDTSETIARDTIRAIPDGVYEFEDFMDGDSIDNQVIRIKVKLTVSGDEVEIDCSESADQVRGAINATIAATKSMSYTALRVLMPKHTSTNSGYMRPIKVVARPGSILNCVMPAATAGRAATGYRLMDTIFGALAQAVPDRIMAAGDGSPLMFSIGGRDDAGEPFVFVDLMRGSWGARPHADGLDGTALAVSTGSSIPGELVELEHPVRLERCGFITDSCGAGKFRGGMAVVRDYRLLADEATLQYRSERRKYRPYGLAGGGAGCASLIIWDPNGEHALLPEKGERKMRKGDVVRFVQASGGGFGDPFDRDMEQVARDVADGLITAQAAKDLYGVSVSDVTGQLDRAETERVRASHKAIQSGNRPDVKPVTVDDLAFIMEASRKLAVH